VTDDRGSGAPSYAFFALGGIQRLLVISFLHWSPRSAQAGPCCAPQPIAQFIRQFLTHLSTGVRRYSGQMRNSSQQKSPVEVVAVLSDLVSHPAQTFFYSWNWKSAVLSAMLRAPIFLVATMRHGLKAISIAVITEVVFSGVISGCYGAVVQRLRRARPLWAASLLILIVFPVLVLWLDCLLHLFTGMPNLKGGMLGAGALCLLSSLFNWYVMSRNGLLVGEGAHSFSSDLKRMPRLVMEFVSAFPRHCYRLLRSNSLHMQA
jgi:hypothetical protein